MKKAKYNKTQINNTKSVEARSLYEKLREATEQQTPLDSTAQMIYTERKDGVMPGFDIRTDRFEIAQQQMQNAYDRGVAKRDEGGSQKTTEDVEAKSE